MIPRASFQIWPCGIETAVRELRVSMVEDGWTTVTAKDKKRVMRRSGVRQRQEKSSASAEQQKSHGTIMQSSLLMDGLIYSDKVLCKCIDDCMGAIVKSDLFTNLCSSLQDWVDNTATNTRVGQVVAYGIGNFSNTRATYHSASLWQLALALCIQKNVQIFNKFVIKFDFFDPCTTDDECKFLQERFDVNVMPTNDQGNYIVDDSVDTIFLMPHCPAQLYENVVWSNYFNLQRFVLIGNSLQNLATRPSPNELVCLQTLLPNLKETPLIGSPADYKMTASYGNFVGAWNDTYISYFDVHRAAIASRPYDQFNSKSADLELM